MRSRSAPVNLKALAEKLGLAQSTVSMALGPGAASSGVAAKTRERVLKAARELNYQPNFHAQSLSSGKSYTIGVLVPFISEGYYAALIAGLETSLLSKDYFFFVTSHHCQEEMIRRLPESLIRRKVEGLVVVNTKLGDLPVPTVRIGGSVLHTNSTNLRIHEEHGTHLALEHLVRLGHRQIAFLRGEPESAAADERWNGLLRSAHGLDINIDRKRTVQLKLLRGVDTPDATTIGQMAMEELLARKVRFTALVAYNDSTAIGATRTLQAAGLRVPQDVSVVGYDDIPAAMYERPKLTTIRQPLQRMGALAAEALLNRIEGREAPNEILVEPELVQRGTVGPPPVERADTRKSLRSKVSAAGPSLAHNA